MHIVTRRQWGARYADGFGALPPPAAEVWLHHTGGDEPDSPAGIRQLEQVGQDRFGGGISYTFLVGQTGTVYEGTSSNREGSHTFGHNTVGRGICWIGNYEIATPTDAIIQATAELLAIGQTNGWWTRAALTGGHHDVVNTACPGKHAYAVIREVNRHAADLAAGKPGPAPDAIPLMEYGQTSDTIRRLQTWLNTMFPSYSRISPVSGYYGDQTTAVIREFQRRVGIVGGDGRNVGVQTRAKLYEHGFRG